MQLYFGLLVVLLLNVCSGYEVCKNEDKEECMKKNQKTLQELATLDETGKDAMKQFCKHMHLLFCEVDKDLKFCGEDVPSNIKDILSEFCSSGTTGLFKGDFWIILSVSVAYFLNKML
ncbi:hypothetical protein JTE90_008728 [Oedothorax gibbosus]|uniref:Uncharacterized protein n=1 Tax=Oedothorax gibbosus TaxID=931172 RepID=A0AAV6UQY2_9ARAC|nr:hypothetical protein JTE90_008728 [Oedothorax gibbosus]